MMVGMFVGCKCSQCSKCGVAVKVNMTAYQDDYPNEQGDINCCGVSLTNVDSDNDGVVDCKATTQTQK